MVDLFIPVDEWRRRGATTDCGGRRIFYVDSEAGATSGKPVIFLIHGFPTASWDWHAVWPTLAEHHRLIAPDMLGFGFSEKPPGHRYTIHEQADLMDALQRQLGLDRFHVLAHDYGDTVAQELLARENAAPAARRRWRSVCFLNGGLFPETHRARLSQKLLAGPAGALFNRLMSRGTLTRNLHAIAGPDNPPGAREIDAFWTLMHHGGRFPAHRLIGYMRDRRQHRERWLAALRECCVPLQLINGSADPVSGEHMVRRFRELVGDGDLAEMPGVGHYPQLEAPGVVSRYYLDFLRRQSEGG